MNSVVLSLTFFAVSRRIFTKVEMNSAETALPDPDCLKCIAAVFFRMGIIQTEYCGFAALGEEA